MMTLTRTLSVARRSLALSFVLGASFTAAGAQQSAASAATATPALNFNFPVQQPAETYSSSADDQVLASAENPFDFMKLSTDQPPARRTYSRPRYRGGNTNADGSNKYTFMAGVGFTQALGNTYHYLSPKYGITVGGGRNFNKNFGVLLEYDYDRFGFNNRTLTNQYNLYNTILGYYGQTGVSSLDGNTHIHSVSIEPTYTFTSREGFGGYVVAGAGFYHKVADFTVPTTGTYCDYYYGCYQYQANQIIDHYFSNAPGFNAGVGVTYKLSRFSSAKIFAEAKYVYIVTSQKQGITISTVNGTNYQAFNDFPANSNRTSYMPVKFGIRF